MGVEGSEYYQSYKHLNAKVIKPAVAEVNKVSDIIVTPETRKMGRSVSDIRFLIRRNPQLAIMNIDDGEGARTTRTYARLMELGVSDRLARQWISEHGEAYVAGKIDYVTGQPEVRSPAKYLSRAISEDYVAPDAPRSERAGDPAIKARAAKLKRVQELVQARSPTQRDADKRLFMSQLTTNSERLDFENHGWMSALNAEAIFQFWAELAPEDAE